jgi:plastocyanin
VFKAWQIFVFSLIPLGLVFAGVIGGSFYGSDSEPDIFPTAAPPPANGAVAPTPSAPGATVIQLIAASLQWNTRSISATANQPVTVQMDNRDAGVLHNVSLYRDQARSQRVFVGELHTGPGIKVYTFTAPAPGNYFFVCDVHPDTMTGSFVSR